MEIEEFKKKVEEIWQKVDFEEESAQKNRIFLQSLKNICAHALEEPDLSSELENEIKQNLFRAENEMAKLKTQSKDPFQSPIGKQKNEDKDKRRKNDFEKQTQRAEPADLSLNSSDKNEPLQSVDAGQFDPSTSPILRNLHRKNLSQKRKKPKEKTKPVPEPLDSSTSAKEKAENLPLDLNKFPSTEPEQDKGKEDKKQEVNVPYQNAILYFPQLKTEIPLNFSKNTIAINRQFFQGRSYPFKIPPEFFSSIHETQHCIIEQPEKGTFILKDPNNLQKTYFHNKFIDDHGEPLEEQDEFILPVIIEGNESSLKGIFRTD